MYKVSKRYIFPVLFVVISTLWFDPNKLAQAKQIEPSYGPVTVALDYTDSTFIPIDALSVFPEGIQHLVALMPVKNIPAGSTVEAFWFRDKEPVGNPSIGLNNANAYLEFSVLELEKGFSEGNWEVDFHYNGQVVGAGTFKVQGGAFILPLTFGGDCQHYTGEMFNPGVTFPQQIKNISARIRYSNLPANSKIEVQWFQGDVPQPLTSSSSQRDGTGYYCNSLGNNDGIPMGVYKVKVLVNDIILQTGTISVK